MSEQVNAELLAKYHELSIQVRELRESLTKAYASLDATQGELLREVGRRVKAEAERDEAIRLLAESRRLSLPAEEVADEAHG